MKTRKLIILTGILLVIVSSCKNYLDPWPNGNYDSETIWNYQNLVQGLINRGYDNIAASSVGSSTRNYNDNEGIYLDGATDNAVLTVTTNVMDRYATNSMTISQDPFQTYWDRDYRSISQCNMFLKDNRGLHTRYMVNAHFNDMVRNRLQGEAFALRAWFEWDLLQKFGGKGTNGQILGFPIITQPISVTDQVDYARNTYEECVKQIAADCDSAIKYLPIAHRDYLVSSSSDLVYSGGQYWSRFDGITMYAIKSNMYLTWASPRFNPDNVLARWDSAAFNAKKVIDFKLTGPDASTYAGNPNASKAFNPVNSVIWTDPNNPEIVFSTRYNNSNNVIEKALYPGSFQGNGEIGPTQELVNSFGMANGYPIDDPTNRGGYDPTQPYLNRDPRFYSTIFYNTAVYKKNNTGTTMYTFECWNTGNGTTLTGKDASGVSSKTSRTNYYIKKFCYAGLNFSDASPTAGSHSKYLIRWSHMALNFAEAANHATGSPNTALYGMTAKQAIKYLRARKTYDGLTPTYNVTDPYLDEVATAGETSFDNLVKNERRIETCFEGMRFYDIRRWTKDDNWESNLNITTHGAYITQVAGSPVTYTYNLNSAVEDRIFSSPYNPLPYNEILRMSKLVQNEGWPSWN
jgi:starch-binding outer membrane protein, SusD/RagB family